MDFVIKQLHTDSKYHQSYNGLFLGMSNSCFPAFQDVEASFLQFQGSKVKFTQETLHVDANLFLNYQ